MLLVGRFVCQQAPLGVPSGRSTPHPLHPASNKLFVQAPVAVSRCRDSLKIHAAASSSAVEAVSGIRPEVNAAIAAAINDCIVDTELGIGKKYRVR